MNGTLQEWYWLSGMAVGLIATVINIALFQRNKPDKIKAAIQQAIEPLLRRLEQGEAAQDLYQKELERQGRTLIRIESEIKHVPTQGKIDEINARLMELLKQTSEDRGAQRVEAVLLDRINRYLMGGRGE